MKIPTAKEWLSSAPADESWDLMNITTNAMIEFAKLHVKTALKAADEKAEYELPEGTWDYLEDKNFILNAYPLENIK